MKLWKLISVLLVSIFLLSACGSDDSEDASEKEVPSYEIVEEEESENGERKQIRATTDVTDEANFEAITEEIMTEYEDEDLDSMNFYIHEPDGDSYGALKASVLVAFTQRGVALTGIEEANSYEIEMK